MGIYDNNNGVETRGSNEDTALVAAAVAVRLTQRRRYPTPAIGADTRSASTFEIGRAPRSGSRIVASGHPSYREIVSYIARMTKT